MSETPRRVIVLGAGAIGASTGALLFERGVPTTLVVRPAHAEAIAARGVDLRFPASARTVRVPVVTSLAETAPTSEDLVILATMGHHTEHALADLDRSVPVASFQNGTTPLDDIARRGHETIAAMVYVPAERRGPGVIALAGVPRVGAVMVGGWPTGEGRFAPWLVASLSDAGFHAELEPDIAPWIRAKLLVNLGGIVIALSDDYPREVVGAAQDEARAVWRAHHAPFEEIETLMKRIGPHDAALVDGLPRVGGSTRAALARGDRLETAYLHDAIVSGGRAAGVPTPVNDALVALAEEAARDRWTPGALSGAELRRRVGLAG